MADRMPPPGLTVVIGHAKGDVPRETSGRMPPPGMKSDAKGSQKALPEDAGVVRDGEHCIDCKNYDATSGDCAKVEGSYAPGDGCVQYFSPLSDKEPDEDDAGGPSDEDEDDQGMQ